jgi:hypothetical protein
MGADLNTVWAIISISFFIGGITIGYYAPHWRRSRKPRGYGRWD